MTTMAEATERIYQAFVDGWGATSEYLFDNERSDDIPGTNTPWVRLAVRHRTRAQESLGAVGTRKFESGGAVFVQCFAPLDNGRAIAENLASTARGIFEGKHLAPEGLRFTSAVIREIGETKDGFYQVNVEAFFTYTETK